MSAIDTEIAFATMMARAAQEHALTTGPIAIDEADGDDQPSSNLMVRLQMLSVVAALGILSLVTLFAGMSALTAAEPTIWIHRLMALSLTETILFAAMVMKFMTVADVGQQTTRILVPDLPPMLEQPRAAAPPPQIEPVISRPVLVGHGSLAGRQYTEYSDGSIEIATMLGRRRFVSLELAREFVGA